MTSSTDVAITEKKKKCVFFDMVHSNTAARIRLWLQLNRLEDAVESKLIATSAELQTPEYMKINPLKKVPAFITDTGMGLFESSVIMGYLEDKFGRSSNNDSNTTIELVMDTPEDRAFVELIVRCHDLYVASANCNQPHFSHTQGCMYLDPTPTQFTPERRTMDTATRAAKLAELHQQLIFLEQQTRGPYIAGAAMTHADLTWYPTMVMMVFMLPKSFGWSEDFLEPLSSSLSHFPKLAAWFQLCSANQHFGRMQKVFVDEYRAEYDQGLLVGVREDVDQHPEYKWKYA